MNTWIRNALAGLALASVLLLSGCGNGSKKDILDKAEKLKTKAELQSALGEPDDVSKLGPIETWTYNASDGKVSFVITGDKVAISAAGGSKEDE